MRIVASCLLLACVACHPALPARDEARGAIYSVEWGLQKSDEACATVADDDIKRLNLTAAQDTAGECARALDEVRPVMVNAFRTLTAWDADGLRHVACAMPTAVHALESLRVTLASRGIDLDEATDGQARAKWLAGWCGK